MFSQSADQPAADESPAPAGLRELPPQPARPVMPAFATATEPAARPTSPTGDDSVIARDDHFEGTFTSRGTVVVMGSVKGRIEAVQVRIEDGAHVEADVIVDEAIVAGEFTGNLTCRQRLEAHASGRISGRVETHKLMLHEGASVEGEMHMLTDAPVSAAETIRGSAPLRGGETAPAESPSRVSVSTSSTVADAPLADAPAATKPAPAVTPSSAAPKTPVAAVSSPAATSPTPATAPKVEASASARRSSVAETLRAETLRVAPRTSTSAASYSGSTTKATANGSRGRTTTTGF